MGLVVVMGLENGYYLFVFVMGYFLFSGGQGCQQFIRVVSVVINKGNVVVVIFVFKVLFGIIKIGDCLGNNGEI